MLTFLLNSLPDSGYESLCAYLNAGTNAKIKQWLVGILVYHFLLDISKFAIFDFSAEDEEMRRTPDR